MIISPPLESTHAWQHRVLHDITALGLHTRSNDVGRGMPSLPLGSTHGRTTSDVACHHSPWTANTVKGHQAWHVIITFGQHKQSDDIGCGIPSPPLDSTQGRMTSGVACHHRPWTGNTVEQHRAWHAITALGQHTQLDDVGRGMLSSHLGSTNSRTTSGVSCNHRPCIAHKVG